MLLEPAGCRRYQFVLLLQFSGGAL